MKEEYQITQLQKDKSELQDLHEHLPDWIKILKELYISESERREQEKS